MFWCDALIAHYVEWEKKRMGIDMRVDVKWRSIPWKERPKVCVYIRIRRNETVPDRATIYYNHHKLFPFMTHHRLSLTRVIRHELGHILAFNAGAKDEHAWMRRNRPDLVLPLKKEPARLKQSKLMLTK